jgi:hypothetical protein
MPGRVRFRWIRENNEMQTNAHKPRRSKTCLSSGLVIVVTQDAVYPNSDASSCWVPFCKGLHPRSSVRRASAFVLTGNSEDGRQALLFLDRRLYGSCWR